MIDLKDEFAWEGTQVRDGANSRGHLNHYGGSNYGLFNTVNVNFFRDDRYICVGTSPDDDCR